MFLLITAGFSAPLVLSYDLSQFLGVEMLSRGEAVKKLWEYIKEKELQNPADKRVILCDSKLEQLFKRKKINMFKMSAELSSVSCGAATLVSPVSHGSGMLCYADDDVSKRMGYFLPHIALQDPRETSQSKEGEGIGEGG